MKPYNKEYILEVLEEYNNAIKNGSKGLYKIDRKIFKKKDMVL